MEHKIMVTGASGGFGALICKTLLKDGNQVVGTVRSIKNNQVITNELKSTGVQFVEMDVTEENSVNTAIDETITCLGGLDVVINNAGVGVRGMQEHFTADDFSRVFNVNVFGVQRVMRAVLPFLRKQGSGSIFYISSLLGRVTLPFYGPYNASKWALEAMAENYRTELSGFGIESCVVEPGGFATAFLDKLIQPSDTSRNESYGDFMNVPRAMANGFKESLANNLEQNPQKVADAVSTLLKMPHGEKPLRTTVDFTGMAEPIQSYNEMLDNVTKRLYTAFGNEGMLTVKNKPSRE